MLKMSDIAKELETAARAGNGYAAVTLTSGLQLHLTIQGHGRHLAIERDDESPAMSEVAKCLTAFFPGGNNLELKFDSGYHRVDIYQCEGGQA